MQTLELIRVTCPQFDFTEIIFISTSLNQQSFLRRVVRAKKRVWREVRIVDKQTHIEVICTDLI